MVPLQSCHADGLTRMSDHRFLRFATLAFLALGLVLILRPSDNEYVQVLGQAKAHAEALERTAAVEAYREAANVRPDSAAPYLFLARLYLGWGRTDEALGALEKAERLEGGGIAVERLRVAIGVAGAEASVAGRPAQWRGVASDARGLLALVPGDRDARHTLARAYLELREWEEAGSIYRELVRSDPTDRHARDRLGLLLVGDDPEALEHLRTAQTDLSQRVLEALAEAGAAADTAYRAARVGRVLIEREEWALAARQLELALSDRPTHAEAQALLGHALDQMGYREEAMDYLLDAVAGAPQSSVAHTLLGLHYVKSGDPVAARHHLETAYDLAPENPAICVEIGNSWAAEGRYVAAEIWFREAVSLRPEDPRLWEILARFYLEYGITSDERAVAATEELLKLVPNGASARDLRGWAALEAGEYDIAGEHLRRAIELDSGLASAYYHLGLLESRRGHPELAREAFTRAIDLDTEGRFISLVTRHTAGRTIDED